jgi:cation transport regulator ChaC
MIDVHQPTWVFGYGSLIWKQDFPFLREEPAHIIGWARRFWQGSHDHRGNEVNPGRVVTLVAASGQACHGKAFLVEPEVFDHLDHREKNGYQRLGLRIFMANGAVEDGITYRATANNVAFLGADDLQNMAAQINTSSGPSGSNTSYVLELARALRSLGVRDEHVFDVEQAVIAHTENHSTL